MVFRYLSLYLLYINTKIGKNRCLMLESSRWPPVWETAVHLAVAGGVFDGVFLCCPFFPLDVLDEIWDLIEPVSEGFPTYSYSMFFKKQFISYRSFFA